MMPPDIKKGDNMTVYRVQEYVHDMGIFHKASIHHLPESIYNDVNFGENPSRSRRLVILPADDPYGEKLPPRVRTWPEMTELVEKALYTERISKNTAKVGEG